MINQPLPADHFTPDGVFLLNPKHRDVALGLRPYRSETSEASCLGWFIFFLIIAVPSVGAILYLFAGSILNGLILAVVAISIVGYSIFKFQRDHRLEQNGQLLRGTLLKIEGQKDSDGDYHMEARYQFQSPRGLPLEGRYSAWRNDLKKYTLPPAGSLMAVWYADDKTHIML